MADAKYRVAVTYSPSNKASTQWVAGMKEKGYDFQAYPCDVADYDSCKTCVESVASNLGPVDILVNNAGITRDLTFRKMTKADWDAVMRTNLDSTFNMTKQVYDGMMDRSWGRIINVSSVNGSKGAFGQTNYAAAKAGMHGFTKSLALEFGAQGRHRQHHLSGLHRHQDGDGHPRERAAGQDPAADSGIPSRQARGDRRPHHLPVLGGSRLRHRRQYRHQRRPAYAVKPRPDGAASIMNSAITLKKVDVFLYRAPIKEPIVTSFGSIPARVALLIRVEDKDGAHGWGEVWANFPPSGAESKARLLETVVVPTALGRTYASPTAAWIDLTARMRRNAIQSAEPGPFAACIAGIDVALWDLVARRAGIPLWRALGRTDSPAPLPAYASNLNPKGAPEYVAACRERGYRAFKLKVAFNLETDLENVRRISHDLRDGEHFMIDANQGWDLATARPAVEAFSQYPLQWIEEPICADDPAGALGRARPAEPCAHRRR